MTTAPHPVDLHLGARLRLRRKKAGLSQDALAGAVNITFQQIQKYENGKNRISASRLYQLANLLGVGPGWFFVGLSPAMVKTPPACRRGHGLRR